MLALKIQRNNISKTLNNKGITNFKIQIHEPTQTIDLFVDHTVSEQLAQQLIKAFPAVRIHDL